MTTPGSNSGIYFIRPTRKRAGRRKVTRCRSIIRTPMAKDREPVWDTGHKRSLCKDNEWFTEYIKVEGKRVIVKLNDKMVVDYTEPVDVKEIPVMKAVSYQAERLRCRAMIRIVKCILRILWLRFCRIEDSVCQSAACPDKGRMVQIN